MKHLIVRKNIDFPSFGASKWRKQDHGIPLSLQLTQAKAMIYLDEEKYPGKRDVIVFPSGRMELHYSPAPTDLLRSLASKGLASAAAAEQIYAAYLEAHTKFEALLYTAGKVRYLMGMGPESMSNFFSGGFSRTVSSNGVSTAARTRRFSPRWLSHAVAILCTPRLS